MGFGQKIARLLGFGNDADLDYNMELQDSADPSAEAPKLGSASTDEKSPAREVSQQIALGIDSEHIDLIFGSVVKIFNEALPNFLAQSVDSEKQRQLLYDSLDASLKDYLTAVRRSAYEQCQADWAVEREKLQADAEELRKHAAELEEKKSQLKDRQLSAERQKRAFSERVKDLEEQVMRLEAEKEQLDIENKCMLNKAKAAAVLEAQLEDMQQAKAQLEDMQLAKTREEMNDAMLSDFKKQAAEAAKELKSVNEQLAQAQEQMVLKDAQIDDLRKDIEAKEAMIAEKEALITEKETLIAEKESQIGQLEAELEDSVSQEELDQIQGQVEQFEEVRSKMDAHIEKLRESLRKSQEENKNLHESIKYHIEEKTRLQQELANKAAQGASSEPQPSPENEHPATAVADEPKRKGPSRKGKRSAMLDDVDDIISGADWLVSVPPEESPMRVQEDAAPFGYNPPQRKRQVENDAQMSLFDL